MGVVIRNAYPKSWKANATHKKHIQVCHQIWNFPNILLLLFFYRFSFRYFTSIILEGAYSRNVCIVCTISWCQILNRWKDKFPCSTVTGRIVKTMIFPALRVSTIWYWPAEFRDRGCLFNSSHRYPGVHTGVGSCRQWTRWLDGHSFHRTVKPTHFHINPSAMNLNSIWQPLPDANHREGWEIMSQKQTKSKIGFCLLAISYPCWKSWPFNFSLLAILPSFMFRSRSDFIKSEMLFCTETIFNP